MRFRRLLGIMLAGPAVCLSVPVWGAGVPYVAPVGIIFDTDMSSDCDDVGALAILNKMGDFRECKILACVANGHDQDKAIAASIDAVNTYYGHPGILIGTYQGPGFPPTKSPYTAALRDEFPHTARPDDQEPKAVNVYRKALADASDGSVTVVSVGYLVNLRDLLESQPDSSSPLGGTELVRKKVKQIVVMGGAYPKGDPGEYNFSGQGGGPDTQFVVEHWPTPMLFSGAEIGSGIVTGKKTVMLPAKDPVRRAYDLYTHFAGRESWDLTAALAAVRPPELYWTVVANGYCVVAADGRDSWSTAPRGHSYLVAKEATSDMAAILDDLMTLPPRQH